MSLNTIPSPCFVLEEEKLRRNLALIQDVSQRAEIDIILAFKGFSMWSAFPIVREYISGATASSLNEMLLCNEHMKTASHTYCVAYADQDFDQICEGSSHLTFNSLQQFERFKHKCAEQKVSVGLRINPEESDVETALYNPASPHSRLGITKDELSGGLPEGVEGLHVHVLCESTSYALEKVLKAVEEKFGHLLPKAQWLNLGGGHLMTRKGYDTDHLVQILRDFKTKHDLKIILEPGSAFAWETGFLKTTVLDVVSRNGVNTAIIDASFTCHMPDCLEMPYRPNLIEGSREVEGKKFLYRLGGVSCLAGDFLEEYGFDQELKIGDSITFLDMIHYTMVKTSTFNGVPHPSIGILTPGGTFKIVKEFGYEDFRNRLS
ncbi:carboxynorspermidine decarboxylase [Reichenbachiella agarivorans]|uniref:Carboxynorspermidine/carboxyspermidine decarboxylase n=1 Tax=Reichenbachiella agarivorans TaxID=2979464 RepID=A0ABY6CLN9_9BACT|nr:carboxynorspermidine decarboxylase [Reichenbachiella agarivorans]UXP31436.1 carboxynorspermidine decarboxylase [Reichenbachiella agarivorans]